MIKEITIEGIPEINNKKKTVLWSSLSEKEINTQMNEIFSDNIYKLARRKKNSVYLDIGANIGMTAFYFNDWAKTIYSIEPSKECFKSLEHNTKDMKNVKVFNYAIADNTGVMPLFGTDPDSSPQTLKLPPGQQITNVENVQCITIDKFFEDNKIDHVDVMKIDVEGYEYEILAGLSFAKVADKIDFIIGEGHITEDGGIPEFIPEILKEYGFTTKFTDSKTYTRNLNIYYGNTLKTYSVLINNIFYAERIK